MLAEVLRGVLPREALHSQLASPLLSFDHAQTGDVAIGTVAGRDVISIGTLQLLLPPPPPLDPLALLAAMPVEDDAPIPSATSFTLTAVPRRIELLPNEQFTGRNAELRALARAKAGESVVVTTGMGGVGKTSLAVEFAHRYGRYFAGGVFWIDCADPERVPLDNARRVPRRYQAAATRAAGPGQRRRDLCAHAGGAAACDRAVRGADPGAGAARPRR